MTPEILAPAGSEEALRAAVRCGANAIYLGLQRYSARAHAQNFTIESLRDAIRYCRPRGVLVYVALNTLLLDSEINDFAKNVRDLCALSIDAVIVQDIGAARLIREIAPDLPLHASTQMSVQSLSGLQELAGLGFNRAVLPRELSREELAQIIPAAPLECEVFVHGALCTSLSGQCLMSAFFGGRSANRGDCAQPCRLPFRRPDEKNEQYLLSLKDLSLLDFLPELAKMGVASFKIEGRMKRPEYVAAAVTACRQALEGGIDYKLRENLQNVFSRSGFTSGYYDGVRGRNMEGFRRKEDVIAAKNALPSLAALYAKETPRYAVKFSLTANAGDVPELTAIAQECKVMVHGSGPVEQSHSGITNPERICEQLSKCGNTPFYCSGSTLQIGEGVHLPLSAVNALRRDALAQLEKKLAQRLAIYCAEYMQTNVRPCTDAKQSLHLRVENISQIPADLSGVSRIILPLNTQKLPELPLDITSAVEIPRGIFGNDNDILQKLRRAKSLGFRLAIAAGPDGAALAKRAGLPFALGFGSNICNTQSLQAWQKSGARDVLISPEITQSQAAELGGEIPRSVFAYGRLPLMLNRRQLPEMRNEDTKLLSAGTYIIDRLGKKFPLLCNEYEYSEVLACTPVYLGDRQHEFSFAGALLLWFTDESPNECCEIINSFRNGKLPMSEYMRGLPGWR